MEKQEPSTNYLNNPGQSRADLRRSKYSKFQKKPGVVVHTWVRQEDPDFQASLLQSESYIVTPGPQ
jgi:hypothetical protein